MRLGVVLAERRMSRSLLPESRIHPAIREKVATFHDEAVAEVQRAIDAHDVVVVGMAQNPFPRKARRLLERNQIAHEYLSWGSYMSEWRKRLAIKLWTGWPTFPQIFVKGELIGGYQDLQRLLDSGELEQLLSAPRR